MRTTKIFMPILLFVFLSFASLCSAGELVFKDKSSFENFIVLVIPENGQEILVPKYDNDFVVNLDDFSDNERITIGVRFFVPNEKGAESFEVIGAQTMQVDISVKVTPGLKDGATVPVFYFDSIGRRGFDQIDPIADSLTERHFERFFKSALMAEHYYLRMGTTNSSVYRRAVHLWREASYILGAQKLDWWLIGTDIERASERAFANAPERHQRTLDYKAIVNAR